MKMSDRGWSMLQCMAALIIGLGIVAYGSARSWAWLVVIGAVIWIGGTLASLIRYAR